MDDGLPVGRQGRWSVVYRLSSVPQNQAASLIPPVYYDSLLNGLQILIVERHTEPTATVSFMVKNGAAFDRAGKEGTADLTARLLISGTRRYDDKTLTQHLQELKATMEVITTWDATTFTAQLPAEGLSHFLRLLAHLMFRPTFSESEIASLKQQRLADLQRRQLSPSELATMELDHILYEPHPYARPREGTPSSVQAIEPVDIENYHRRFYLANDAVLVIVGNVSPAAIMPMIRPTFGGLLRGKVVPDTFTAPGKREGIRIKIIDRPDLDEAHVRLGVLTAARGNERYPAFLLLNHLLGGTNTSRLARLAGSFSPEKAAITSHLEARALLGAFYVSITARPQMAPAALTSVLQGLKEVSTEPISSAEMSAAKRYFVERLPDQLQTGRHIAEQVQAIELYRLGRDYVMTFEQRLDQVTLDQIKQAAESLSAQPVSIVVVGRAADMAEELKKIGTVEVK
jgi:zinc protease